ncbi:nitrous oxide reductase family maturation protein NosD [Lutibacter sp.]|uniref:nitrous oxide reductase family maturation protein NosD n=1 Tax=Lutibacter sp. TaxID=1925666 RepID=UPI0025C4953D|nr:nitrous oxide reductase family maturation protein NosD [Lutibacter sp.]MCF6168449.1 nitrous oxide reductase family maturation protein NosD [Lutibacter sp.]
MKFKIFFFLFFSVLTISAKQIEVCHSCTIKTISEAIKISVAGDEIFVKKGIYKEQNIIIDKSISLIGEKGAVIDGENEGGILIFETDNFTIKGIKIINVGISYTIDYAAIKVVKAQNFIIEDCILEGVFFGILIEKSKKGIIRNNKISSNRKNEASSGNGIHIWSGSEMEIYNNELFGLRDGLYFEFVKKSEIYKNVSHDNIRYGLHFMFSNHNIYHHNEFRNNGAGVAVMFSKFITMYNNTFKLNWGSASYGLLLKEIYDAEIYNNLFEENTIGINGEGCTRINYTNNTFLRNGWAVKIAGACYANIFEKNDFMHNSLDLAYNSKVNDNKFENNYWSEYTGYDLDKDGVGDIPYRPVKLFSYIVNKTPEALVLLRSLFVDIINFSEKVSPVFTPDNLMDKKPIMKRIND